MSLVSAAFIFEKYGPRLSTAKLAEFLDVTKPTLYNMLSAGSCPIKTYIDAGKRYADFRDVAKHLDDLRELAA